jgi:N-sulfoglucosamine sulfohydrolase
VIIRDSMAGRAVVGLLSLLFLLPWALAEENQPATSTNGASAHQRPNIVFAFADDWGRFASAYAKLDGLGTVNDVVSTPNFDRIAREGVLFRRAFVSAPSCTPCRSALMSGQHFWRTGRASILVGAIWDGTNLAYPLMLRDAGYHIGKSFKVWSPGNPGDAPFGGRQYAFESAGGRINQFSQHATRMVASGQTVAAAKQALLDEVQGNFDAFLKARPAHQPFHYWFGPTNVHRKWIKGSGKKLWGINPDALQGKMPPFLADEPEIREDLADYLGEAQAFDASIGVLLKRLEEVGELDNTLIVVSGDHGAPGFPHGKCNLYDFGSSVSLAIRGPGVKGGRVVDDLITLPDLAPTFLEYAGQPVPEKMTGRSLKRILESDRSGQVEPARDAVFIGRERHVENARADYTPYPMRAIRTHDHLYVVNFRPERWPLGDPYRLDGDNPPSDSEVTEETRTTLPDEDAGPAKAWLVARRNDPRWKPLFEHAYGKRPREELYDLKSDPHQMRNVAGDPQYAEIRATLEKRLFDELRQTGDPRLIDDGKFFETPPMAGPPAEGGKPRGKGQGKAGKQNPKNSSAPSPNSSKPSDPPQAATLPSDKRLNVVFILADDLGWAETGCYGQKKIPTPHIDRLAAQGMRFTQHYSGAPVCAPSRCVLMTGQHLGHAEIRGNLQARAPLPQYDEGQYPISENATTIAQVFRQAGYATGAMGKWGLGPVGSTGDPNKKGFDLFFGYNCQSVAHSYFPTHVWRNAEKISINDPAIPGSKKQPEGEIKLVDWQGQTYAPQLMIAEATKFLESHGESPFFLYLPFIEPHVAMHPRPESVEKFPKEWDTEAYRGQCGYLPHPRPRAGYAAMISDLDGYVGRVLDTLDKLQIADHTLVVFSSDNGATHAHPGHPQFHVGGADPKFFNSTADLRGYKGSVHEGGLRVPMIARLPGVIPAGKVSDAPSYFADWFPTLCQAAGLTPPANLDGESLWPVLTGGTPPATRKPMVWVFPEYGGQVAVRLGDFKLVRTGLKTKQPGPWQVYDLSRDRGESNDLSATRGDLIAEAEAVLKREVADNRIFPLSIPGVTSADEQAENPAKPAESPPKPTSGANSPNNRPNLIWIMADDLGYGDLGCYGQKIIQTPRLDQMAREGMRFTQFYAGATVCAPSRSVLMTGQHHGRTRVRGNAGQANPSAQALRAEDITVARLLHDAGYQTALIGKWGLGDVGVADTGLPRKQGFDSFFGYLNQQHAHNHFPDFLWRNEERIALPNVITPVGTTGAGYATEAKVFADDLFAEESLKFIGQKHDRPFFLYWSLVTPHANNERTGRLKDGAHVPDYGPYADRDWPNPDKGQAAMITRLDQHVGRLLDELQRLDLAKNTLVIFTSDNGPHNESNHNVARFQPSGPFSGLKRSLTDGGIRVPCIAWWPGQIKPGRKSRHVAYFGDWMATAAQLAGVPLPPGRDSISFVPTLRDDAASQASHEFLYWEFHERGFSQAVLYQDRWKAIRERSLAAPLALFDLTHDIAEKADVADQHPEIIAKIETYLKDARSHSEDWVPKGAPATGGKSKP